MEEITVYLLYIPLKEYWIIIKGDFGVKTFVIEYPNPPVLIDFSGNFEEDSLYFFT
ncbi:hypothetical protein ALNOE001_18050 [Candidatus Methanobinarius endosymbioticus]|uniref:Uncharacterized protein n=1 Tax=Candidatus Methanobinarius endosymbioticus TaxID=2006182 RepID=A0A366MAD8_9EURY|nr:hypothetical protein ALNOE001_18050 [Candidatus Methanobinarius endosymbioticus]